MKANNRPALRAHHAEVQRSSNTATGLMRDIVVKPMFTCGKGHLEAEQR